jgi:hypothetical protein
MPRIKTCHCGKRCATKEEICSACGRSLLFIEAVDVDEVTPESADQGVPSPAGDGPRSAPASSCQHLYRPGHPACVNCNEIPTADALTAMVRWLDTDHTLSIGGACVVGRDDPAPEDLQVLLGADKYANVSRNHAHLRFAGGRLWVTDLKSSNGTFINDRRLAHGVEEELHHGDVVRFGATLTGRIELAGKP